MSIAHHIATLGPIGRTLPTHPVAGAHLLRL